MKIALQFFIGLMFGIGLVISGMSDPQKVLNFLDVAAIATNTWDPSLVFVLGGAVITAFIGYRVTFQRNRPFFDDTFHMPTAKHVDQPLVIGAVIFGIGWGLTGFCPGPAFTALGTGVTPAILFVIAMVVGMIAARWWLLRPTTS